MKAFNGYSLHGRQTSIHCINFKSGEARIATAFGNRFLWLLEMLNGKPKTMYVLLDISCNAY